MSIHNLKRSLRSRLGIGWGLKKKLRIRFKPLVLKLNGTFTTSELIDHLAQTLPRDFEILFIHSSYDGLMPMYRDAVFKLLKALQDFVGPDRTLAMPAFSFGDGPVSWGDWYREHPLFDQVKTTSQMGLLTELFRRQKSSLRSLHPTHSISAMGPLAKELTASHHLAETTFGYGTPYDIMATRKTVILVLGASPYLYLTLVHHAEDLLGERFPAFAGAEMIPVQLRNAQGEEIPYSLRHIRYKGSRNMNRLPNLLGKQTISTWKFHGVPLAWAWASDISNGLLKAAEAGKTIYQ